MVEVIPAIMPQSLKDLLEKAQMVSGLVPLVQIDVMDGSLTKNKTWPYQNDGEIKDFKESLNKPLLDGLDFEVDLMIEDPERVIFDWLNLKPKRIILHQKSSQDILDVISLIRTTATYKVEIGLAIESDVSALVLETALGHVDFVQCMGIKEIGLQGQDFNEEIIRVIKHLRQAYPELIISVDGGVSLETAKVLADSGANRLVSGSAVFESKDIKDTISKLGSLK